MERSAFPSSAGQLLAELRAAEGAHADVVLMHVRAAVDDGLMDIVWLERCPLLEHVRRAPGWASLHTRVAERAETVLEAIRS
jgi:eukaryotic-like serine/threonine-protein kinase